jgi:hypothetical protein
MPSGSGLARALQRKAIEASLDAEINAQDIANQMKAVCPVKVNAYATLVDVTHGPGNQVNYIYEVPADTDTTNGVAERKKVARDWAIRMFHQQGLAKVTEKSGIVWNFVYKKPNGQLAFSMRIGPDDLQEDAEPSKTSLASSNPPTRSSDVWQNQFPKTAAALRDTSANKSRKQTPSARSQQDHGRATRSQLGPGMLSNPYVTKGN